MDSNAAIGGFAPAFRGRNYRIEVTIQVEVGKCCIFDSNQAGPAGYVRGRPGLSHTRGSGIEIEFQFSTLLPATDDIGVTVTVNITRLYSVSA